ncbi:Transcription elongation factor spt6 [Turnera subulata]|uniref:Transcription elongation factor spt6 n=1 Tax=Turnera subulata TaxID=218843 RepID=A0A9Q0J1X5_9ROSI|nr:Transcription elongation factor spt6 [Turnera subulata]
MARRVVFDEDEENEIEGSENVDGERPENYNDDVDDDEDEEEQDEYEKDDFIVDDVDEEEEATSDQSDHEQQRHKKRKKRREFEDLDEDDYILLRDNNAIYSRPKEGKQFKRLKKAQRDSNKHSLGLSNEEKLKRSLFGDDDGLLEDVTEEEEQVEKGEDGDFVVEDEMADFIVDEEEMVENGRRLKPSRPQKRKFGQAMGVSPAALQDAYEIFGDVDELLELRKRGLESGEWRERRLEDEFEPVLVSEKYMTDKDNQIQMIDVPERMQISEKSTSFSPTDDISINEESTWIYNQLAGGTILPFLCQKVTQSAKEGPDLFVNRDDIIRFLKLHHVQKLDIPFIAMYRKEECLSLLRDPDQSEANDQNEYKSDDTPKMKRHKVLWAIKDLDRKWLLLQKRKNALHSNYNKRFKEEMHQIYDKTRHNLNQHLFESILKALKAAETERELDDVDAKFNLQFPPVVGLNEGKYKRPNKRSEYHKNSKAGLWKIANKFGYSSEQLGMQLSLEKMEEELLDAKETPEDMALNFTCAMFETPQAVLKGARHMAAVEISCEPCVRKYVRGIFMRNAVVSTNPTQDGLAIDSFHQFAGVKWLREKPMSSFMDAQWLFIQKAEEEKLLQVTIKLSDDSMEQLINDCKERYLSVGVSKYAQLWNKQRDLILREALFGLLLPLMEKEARLLLASRAKSWLLWEYGKVLWDKVSVGPYQRKETDTSIDNHSAPRVMACCWGPGKPATTFVMLDSSGQVLDVLYTGSLTSRTQNVKYQEQKREDEQRVLKFMMVHRPHVVVLGAANLSCSRLKDDIYEIIFNIVERNPQEAGYEMDDLSIVYGDESLPRLYENSQISSDQLPSQSGIVKRAVALGRYLQNPLAMVATLCGPGREILSWKISPLDNFLTSDEKYAMTEEIMIDVTNQVGFDINLASSHGWLFAPLQFISGLGPRKAASLQRSLLRAGSIFNRKDLLTTHGLGKKVFVNAVGFLRVRRSGLAASTSQLIDLLDDTRIHPESYGLALEMAKDVYRELDNAEANDDDDDAQEMAIEYIRNHPNKLKMFDLGRYLEDKRLDSKKDTLKDIIKELMHGFQDFRTQYKEPSQDETFYMLSGESENTLADGRIVQATVRKVLGPKAICVLESGLTGMLMKEDYADDSWDIRDLSDRLHEGDIISCKIKSVLKNKNQVLLVCKESEMRNNWNRLVQILDPYYHEDWTSLQNKHEKPCNKKGLARKHLKPRMIVHPRFHNITTDEAIEFLSDKDYGESIFSPSSRGVSYLTLTLKIYDGVYSHISIAEDGKEDKDIATLLRIGKILKIGEETFEDLDEVLDRYVDPLLGHLKAMLSYRRFRRGNKAEVDELLRKEKLEEPKRVVYSFGISHNHPGHFILSYLRNINVHHEDVVLCPKGFKFRERMFKGIDELVRYFKGWLLPEQPSHKAAAA